MASFTRKLRPALLSRASVMALPLALPLALAACGGGQSRMDDPYFDHPIEAVASTYSASVLSDGHGRVSAPHDGWASVATAYSRRGRGSLLLQGTSADVAAARRALEQAGVSSGSIRTDVQGTRGRVGVQLSFATWRALLPECGDMSSDRDSLFLSPTNRTTSNFGCNVRRNIGMMLADPGDLVAPRGSMEHGMATTGRSMGRVGDYGTYVAPPAPTLTSGSGK